MRELGSFRLIAGLLRKVPKTNRRVNDNMGSKRRRDFERLHDGIEHGLKFLQGELNLWFATKVLIRNESEYVRRALIFRLPVFYVKESVQFSI